MSNFRISSLSGFRLSGAFQGCWGTPPSKFCCLETVFRVVPTLHEGKLRNYWKSSASTQNPCFGLHGVYREPEAYSYALLCRSPLPRACLRLFCNVKTSKLWRSSKPRKTSCSARVRLLKRNAHSFCLRCVLRFSHWKPDKAGRSPLLAPQDTAQLLHRVA